MKMAIAIDVGGHGAKGLVVAEDGSPRGQALVVRYPSAVRNPGIDKRDVPGQERHAAVIQIVSALRAQQPEASYVGIATTGTVDPITATIVRDQSPTYQGTVWPKVLLDAGVIGANSVVSVQNDAKAGAWAEYRLWQRHPLAARAAHPNMFVRVTVGSGVGSAIIHNQRLVVGAGFVAGEFTYMPFRPPAELAGFIPEVDCNDKRRGCTESYAASPGILRGAQAAVAQRQSAWARSIKNPSGMTILDVVAGYQAGDPGIVGVVRTASAALGSALLNLIYLLGPDVVLVGGGVVEQLPDYLPLATQYVSTHGVIAPAIRAALITHAQIHSDDAAALGIALLAFDHGKRASEFKTT